MVSCSGAPVSVQSALEPPAAGIDAERDQSFERREAPSARHVQISERAAPRGGRLPHGHRFVERPLRDRRPRDALLVDEPRRGDRPVGVRLARGQHDPGPGATEHHPEQPAFVLQAGAVALGLRDRPLQRRQVEHRLRAGQAGEVPLDGSRDDDRVELGADGAVRGQHADGVERRGIARRDSPVRARRHRAIAGTPASTGRPSRRPRRRRSESADDDVELAAGAGRSARRRPPAATSTAGPATGSGTRRAPTGPPRSPRARGPRARRRPRRPRPA